ncbi:glycosyltransferase [Chlorobaculum sp. MV4-Y]|uniref:glycosyltransferase n=1 Tax=Chlorobaculum sp. MV4-Y TaxID=2976335 RepID=UPI0021AFC8F7|nr:glycosyltransferase [Chlorobaculum sp. MV4-Y]UWX57854.1 glycosyltransferase [Chlorobaculum sp. MV4-Y]
MFADQTSVILLCFVKCFELYLHFLILFLKPYYSPECPPSFTPAKQTYTTVSCSLQPNHEGASFSVSAVMAVYNPKPEFFRQAVLSVLGQTTPVLELVLVNDGGSDEFKTFLPDDDRIRVFTKPNEGVAATRNFAIKQCRGEYIAFLDQDDYWYPDKLKEQTDMIPALGDICMVISPVDIVDEKNNILKNKKTIKISSTYQRKTSEGDFLLNLSEANFIYSSVPMVHRKVFDDVGLFDSLAQPHDDWDLYLRIVINSIPTYCYRERALSVWRLHDSNESHKVLAMLRSKCQVEKKLIKVVNDKKVHAILNTNLLIDYIERDHIIYKKGRYGCYRVLLRSHLQKLVKEFFNCRGEMYGAYPELRRIRKTILKASRRYVLSYYYEKRHKIIW